MGQESGSPAPAVNEYYAEWLAPMRSPDFTSGAGAGMTVLAWRLGAEVRGGGVVF